LALTTGTMGLLAVGLLMITITPRRAESPIAISASTTPVSVSQGARGPVALAPSGTERIGLRTDSWGVLATPIGDGRFALVTRASVVDMRRTVIDVKLPSGRLSAGSIVTASDDAVIVALATTEPGHAVARHLPEPNEMVTVMSSPPITISYGDVDTLAVEEGTAVLDENGHLVGICSQRSGTEQVRLIEVSGALDDATSVVP
jgi:hypothetical protein